jgi:hypothetical protein
MVVDALTMQANWSPRGCQRQEARVELVEACWVSQSGVTVSVTLRGVLNDYQVLAIPISMYIKGNDAQMT